MNQEEVNKELERHNKVIEQIAQEFGLEAEL